MKIKGEAAFIDQVKIQSEARYDGKYLLVTSLTPAELSTAEVALSYKELWQVANLFRSLKSVLATRPIYHQNDSTIKGHVFCSFLALKLLKELQMRIRDKGWKLEWYDIKRDLEALQEVEISDAGQVYRLCTELAGVCGKVFQAAGVAIPPTVRET